MKFSKLIRKSFFPFALAASCIPLAQAETIGSNEVASSSNGAHEGYQEIHIEKPDNINHPTDCNVFEDPSSVACIGPNDRVYQPKDRLDRIVIKTAEYAGRFVPLLNNKSDGSAYSDLVINDGKRIIADAGYGAINSYSNEQIQKIPFFAQTSVSITGTTDAATSFSIDSLMKLKEMAKDDEGDLKTLLFSQARFSKASSSDGSTTNLGLGIRHRPNDQSLIGANAFLDYRMTNYSSAHSRLGLGGEYLKKGWELRNNWYMSISDEKDVTVSGSTYKERVVPGWDVETGYRFPNNPEMAVFVKAFNWDYTHTQDNSGLEASFSWQATPHTNWEAWVGNQISAGKTVANTALPKTDETFFGLRFKWTGQPVKFRKQNIKKNLVTQMTQPVRRSYEVLVERSTGSFQNRAAGS